MPTYDKEIDVYLKEYDVLRSEIREYIQRIDRYIGIYLAASFAVVAAFLTPGRNYTISSYIEGIQKDSYAVALVLVIPMLNSILQIHLLSFMHAILSMAKYTSLVLGTRVSNILRTSVLAWDKGINLWDKKPWLITRFIAGCTYHALVWVISLSILIFNSEILLVRRGWPLFGLYLAAVILVSLSISLVIRYVRVSIKFSDVYVKRVPGFMTTFCLTVSMLIGTIAVISLSK